MTPLPDSGTQWLIAEGTDPAWSPDASEIYCRSGSRLMAARIDAKSGSRVRSRRVAIEPFAPPLTTTSSIRMVHIALGRPAGRAPGREIRLVLDWFAELRKGSNP